MVNCDCKIDKLSQRCSKIVIVILPQILVIVLANNANQLVSLKFDLSPGDGHGQGFKCEHNHEVQ